VGGEADNTAGGVGCDGGVGGVDGAGFGGGSVEVVGGVAGVRVSFSMDHY
jgi:hypothetical protein